MSSAKRVVVGLFGTLLLAVGFTPSAFAAPAVDLSNIKTDRCADDSFSHGLRAVSCNGTTYQKWEKIFFQDASIWTLKNVKTGRCLDDSSSHGLRAVPCNGTRYQKFYKMDGGAGDGGIIFSRFRNSSTARCVDDSFSHGLRAYQCNGTRYQLWNAWN